MQDRRKITRWVTNKQAKIKFEGAEAFIDCQLQDINFKGLQISLKPKFIKDTVVKFSLVLSDEFNLKVEVWVAWHRTIDGHNVYGLYFTKINDVDKEKIYKFVYKSSPQELSKQWRKEPEEKGGETMEDRRIFARFPAEFPLRFLNLNANREGLVLTCDISAKGIGLVTNEELAPQTPLEMWLEIPDKGEPLYTRGEVVWSKRLEPNKYRIGVNLEKADLMGFSRVLRS